MTCQTGDQIKQDQRTGKRVYEAPRLRNYGAVRELTAGGSGMSDEGSMTTDTTRKL